MSQDRLAGSAGPHVFVDSLDNPILSDEDVSHLERSLRMRDGDPLTVSDGAGSWAQGVLRAGGQVALVGDVHFVPKSAVELTVAFSLVKGSKPELVVQKLTELGIDRIVALVADRSVVRWDDDKVAKATQRWERIALEAAMQSHRVRVPDIAGVVPSHGFFANGSEIAIAHFDGEPIDVSHHTVAIGPEGGWSDNELERAPRRVKIGDTVLRAETAAIATGALLTAVHRNG